MVPRPIAATIISAESSQLGVSWSSLPSTRASVNAANAPTKRSSVSFSHSRCPLNVKSHRTTSRKSPNSVPSGHARRARCPRCSRRRAIRGRLNSGGDGPLAGPRRQIHGQANTRTNAGVGQQHPRPCERGAEGRSYHDKDLRGLDLLAQGSL